MDPEVFASLMLARDIFGQTSRLTRTGVQYGTDLDPTWSKRRRVLSAVILLSLLSTRRAKAAGKAAERATGKGRPNSSWLQQPQEVCLGVALSQAKKSDYLTNFHILPGPIKAARPRPTNMTMHTRAATNLPTL